MKHASASSSFRLLPSAFCLAVAFILLPSSFILSQSTGDYILVKKTATGRAEVTLSPNASNLIRFNGSGGLTSVAAADLSGLSASNISTGSLALARIAQGGATTGQVLTWTGSAWAAQDAAAGGVQLSDNNTWTGTNIFSAQVELSNGTSPTELHIYNDKTSSTNYERGFIGFRDDKLVIGTEAGASGGSQRNLRFETGTGFVTFSGSIHAEAANGLSTSAASYIYWNSRTSMRAPADGVLFVSNYAENGLTRLELGASNFGIHVGTGSPEGAVTGGIGSIYLRKDGGTGTSIYVKESGTGNTGWIAK